MTSPRKKLYNDKGYWKQRFKRFDGKVLEIMNREQVKGLTVPISDYFDLGSIAVSLGTTGEELLERAVSMGLEKTIWDTIVDEMESVKRMRQELG
jgi:hypothetical protein